MDPAQGNSYAHIQFLSYRCPWPFVTSLPLPLPLNGILHTDALHVYVYNLLVLLMWDILQLRAAALAVGEADMEKKFEAASESLRRGIMFANSLYL